MGVTAPQYDIQLASAKKIFLSTDTTTTTPTSSVGLVIGGWYTTASAYFTEPRLNGIIGTLNVNASIPGGSTQNGDIILTPRSSPGITSRIVMAYSGSDGFRIKQSFGSASSFISGAVLLPNITEASQPNVVVVSSTGQLFYTASSAVGGAPTFPFSGSALITGSLTVSGSGITITGSLNAANITGSLFGTASFATTASNILGGLNNYLPIWSGSTQLSSSIIYQSGSNVGIGTGAILPNYKLTVTGSGVSGSFNANNILTVSGSNVIITGSLRQGNIDPSLSIGTWAHTEGSGSQASGIASHAEGLNTTSSGDYSHTEGNLTRATGDYSHAEGYDAWATGDYSHGEGYAPRVGGAYSHGEGFATQTFAPYSHAEGGGAETRGTGSHAEGLGTVTYGRFSHAEGNSTVAYGDYSHAGGVGTISSGSYQTAIGQYNKHNNTDSIFVIGNGATTSSRSDIVNVTTSSVQITGSFAITGSSINFKGLASTAQTHVLAIDTGSGEITVNLKPQPQFTSDVYAGFYSTASVNASSTAPQVIPLTDFTKTPADNCFVAQNGVTLLSNVFQVSTTGMYDITVVLNAVTTNTGTTHFSVFPQYSSNNSTFVSFPLTNNFHTFTGLNYQAVSTFQLYLTANYYNRFLWLDDDFFPLTPSPLTLTYFPAKNVNSITIPFTPSVRVSIRYVGQLTNGC